MFELADEIRARGAEMHVCVDERRDDIGTRLAPLTDIAFDSRSLVSCIPAVVAIIVFVCLVIIYYLVIMFRVSYLMGLRLFFNNIMSNKYVVT